MILLRQMAILFFYMLIGYAMARKNLLKEEQSKLLSFLVVNVANPALILSGCFQCTEEISVSKIANILLWACLIFVGLILLAKVMPRILMAKQEDFGSYRVMTLFSNIGFMGLPVISAAYGGIAVLYASVFLLPFNLLIYTYGISQICGKTKETMSEKHVFLILKKVCNIGVIACVVALVFCFFRVQLPEGVQSAISGLSNLTAPLSMFVIGSSFCEISLRKIMMDIRLLIFSVLKLIVLPFVLILMLRFIIHDIILLEVCYVLLAAPVGSMTAMLSKQYGGNTELIVKGVALTTICSVITMPLVAQWIL